MYLSLVLLSLCVCEAALHEIEKEPAYWNAQAKAALNAALKLHPRHHRAKNLILFLGDGRSTNSYHCDGSIRINIQLSLKKMYIFQKYLLFSY